MFVAGWESCVCPCVRHNSHTIRKEVVGVDLAASFLCLEVE